MVGRVLNARSQQWSTVHGVDLSPPLPACLLAHKHSTHRLFPAASRCSKTRSTTTRCRSRRRSLTSASSFWVSAAHAAMHAVWWLRPTLPRLQPVHSAATPSDRSLSTLPPPFTFTDKVNGENKRVLVYCMTGVSRCAAALPCSPRRRDQMTSVTGSGRKVEPPGRGRRAP